MAYLRPENIETMFANGFRSFKSCDPLGGFIEGRYDAIAVDSKNTIADTVEYQLAEFLFHKKPLIL